MDFDEFLCEMQRLTVVSQQGDLFGNKETLIKESIEMCTKFLKGQNYSVRPPLSYPAKINKLDELISIFYVFLNNTYEKHLLPSSNTKRDRAVAKAFVEKRMQADGISRKDAMQQCALIVQVVIRTPEIFKFETPPTFGIFGQAEMGWITERAIRIINDQITKNEVIATEKAIDEMTERIEKEYMMGHSLEELTACHKKLEEQYGKEENQARNR
jgi:hypothetical protein